MKPVTGSLFVTAMFLCLLASSALGYTRNPYKVLGVEKGADDASIKRAYKKLALKYHPDKNPKGQARFIEIQQAYEILSDADKKREYDLGSGAGGDHGHHRHDQESSRHHSHHHHFHYHQQQQQQYHFYQQQQEQMYERALPSNTSFLTASNFRGLVMYGGRPWLIMIYTEGSSACRDFGPTWESLWKSLGGSTAGAGNSDGASVGLGRIHARFQKNLLQLIARSGGPFPGTMREDELPLLMAVPAGCSDTSCFVRYRGSLRLSVLQDFVANRLLHLPRVPQLQPEDVAAFLRRASQYKVVMVAFGRGGGSGSLALRSLASHQKDMLTVARGHVQEGDSKSAAAWQAALGLSSPPAAGHVVFLRGPGTAPRTLVVQPGKAAGLQEQIDEDGLMWQEVPPLRPATGASLGCLWGRAAAASGRSMIDTCVVAVGPRGPELLEARRRLAVLGRHMALSDSKRDPSMSAAASAYMAGKLRLVWLDASAQRPLCTWLMGIPKAMRPTNSAPPPGTNAAGRAAAVVQTMAAAAAQSPELVRTVCGPAPLDVLGRARDTFGIAARAVGLGSFAMRLQPRRAAHVVVIRPAVDGSSWFRGAASHLRGGRPVFLHAVNADFDLGSLERGLDMELPKLAAWINQMHSEPERNLHASTVFPPALQPDDEPSAVEFVAGRLYEGARLVLRFVMNAGSMATDGSSPLSSEIQVANLVVALLAVVLVQMAFWRRADNRAGDSRTSPRARQQPSPDASDRDDPVGEDSSRGRPRSGSQDRDLFRNRRAMSPSWRSGRRGDTRISDYGEGSDRDVGQDGANSDGGGGEGREEDVPGCRSHSGDVTVRPAEGTGGMVQGEPGEPTSGTGGTGGANTKAVADGCGGNSESMVETETEVSGLHLSSSRGHNSEASGGLGSGGAEAEAVANGSYTGTPVAVSGCDGGAGAGGTDSAGSGARVEELLEGSDEVVDPSAEDVGDGWLAVSNPRSVPK